MDKVLLKAASRRHDDSNIGGTHVKRTFIKETI